jgi:hypothetical protein
MSLGWSILIGMMLGLVVAMVICAIALDHNPQGEFADLRTGGFTPDLYRLFGLTGAIVGAPVAIILTLIGFLRSPTN